LKKYFQATGKPKIRELLQQLQDLGIINKSYQLPTEGTRFYPEAIDFNKTLLSRHFKYDNSLGKEFFDAYPPYV